jgi:hypothetical protein
LKGSQQVILEATGTVGETRGHEGRAEPAAATRDAEIAASRALLFHLGYCVVKTIAKYLDEFNWYVMVGARQIGR